MVIFDLFYPFLTLKPPEYKKISIWRLVLISKNTPHTRAVISRTIQKKKRSGHFRPFFDPKTPKL